MKRIANVLTIGSVVALCNTVAVSQAPHVDLTVVPSEAVAGTFQAITYTFRLGAPMEAGGGIRIELPVAYGETEAYFWSKPQTEYPEAPGYVSVSTRETVEMRTTLGGIAGGIAQFEVASGLIPKGDSVLVTYRGIIQSLARDVEVRYATRSSDSAEWIRGANPPMFRVLPRNASTLVVTTPSDVRIGSPFEVAVVVLDRFGNLASGYRGSVVLSSTDPNRSLPDTYRFTESDSGVHVFTGARFDTLGFQRITASDTDSTLQLSSHFAWVWPSDPPLRRYFGDTHFHTGTGTGHHGFIGARSTGDINTLATKDFQALNSGGDHRGNFTDAASAYRYAKDVVQLDFASSSEHDAILLDSAAWATSQAISEEFYEPERFTTFFAYEWTSGFQHHIVLYRSRGNKVFARSKYPKLAELWRALDDQAKPALTVPHVTWTFDDHPVWDDVNNSYRRIGEIYSLWNNRFLIQPGDIPDRFEVGIENRWSYQYAWHHGHQIGVVGATDNHLGRPGANNYTIYTQHTGGFAVALAEENTRESIWNALQQRRTYATTGTRIYLDFQADGHEMGSEYVATEPPTLDVRVAGSNKLESVEIVRYRNGSYSTVFRVNPDALQIAFSFTDSDFENDCFYYLRVTQVAEYPGRPWSHSSAEMAWSSPIWVAAAGE